MTVQLNGGRATRGARKSMSTVGSGVQLLGHQATFMIGSIRSIPMAMTKYRKEVWRLLLNVTWGNGSIVVGGGTIGVVILLGAFAGLTLGMEGYSALNLLGMGPLTGIISAFGSTRELGPLIAAIAFAAQAGCRFTAQIGAMRVSEEIDALEVLSVQPRAYLVSTRLIASMLAIGPLYAIGLSMNYIAARLVYTFSGGGSLGTYDHYFSTFLTPADVVYSFCKAIIFVAITTLLQCYYGFYSSGGPEGVGISAGKAIRAAIIVVVVVNTLLTMALWGTNSGVRISG